MQSQLLAVLSDALCHFAHPLPETTVTTYGGGRALFLTNRLASFYPDFAAVALIGICIAVILCLISNTEDRPLRSAKTMPVSRKEQKEWQKTDGGVAKILVVPNSEEQQDNDEFAC